MADQVETVYYTGAKPWWMAGSLTADSEDGRGLYVGDEAATADEIFAKSPIMHNFRVEKREGAYWSESRKEFIKVPNERFLVRTDTGKALGRCTERYVTRQALDQFRFWDRIVGEGLARYKTVGILAEGMKVFLNLQMPGGWDIRRMSGKIDRHVPYFLDSLDNTGKGTNKLAGTDTNTVCMNTHNMALNGAQMVWSIAHRGDMDAKYEQVMSALAEVHEAIEEQREVAQTMADTPMDMKEFIEFSTSIFLGVEGEDEEIDEQVAKWFEDASQVSKTKLRNKVQTTAKLFRKGIGNEGVSQYDALNAFTEYFDHFDIGEIRSKVERGRKAGKALTSSIDGRGAKIKTKVRERLMNRNA